MNKTVHQGFVGHTHVILHEWGDHRFAVEVDGQGVRTYEVYKSGPRENERMENEDREVWIDPFKMVEEEPKDTLFVHVYANAERTANENEGAPTTIAIRTDGMTLIQDAMGTLERKV